VKVRDSSGDVWRVSRRWMPWRRRTGDLDLGPGADLAGSGGDDPISFVIALVGLVLMVPFVIIFAFTLLEVAVLLLLLPLAVLGRVLFGRHWHVEVRAGFERVWETEAGDWATSRRVIVDVADQLRRDEHPAQHGDIHP
jgi:hypothetical protein